jgi:hypothetical protein
VQLQQEGVCAFAIFTEPFGSQVDRVMAYQSTNRSLPAIAVEHPIQNVSPEELKKRASTIADAAQRLLEGRWDQ